MFFIIILQHLPVNRPFNFPYIPSPNLPRDSFSITLRIYPLISLKIFLPIFFPIAFSQFSPDLPPNLVHILFSILPKLYVNLSINFHHNSLSLNLSSYYNFSSNFHPNLLNNISKSNSISFSYFSKSLFTNRPISSPNLRPNRSIFYSTIFNIINISHKFLLPNLSLIPSAKLYFSAFYSA